MLSEEDASKKVGFQDTKSINVCRIKVLNQVGKMPKKKFYTRGTLRSIRFPALNRDWLRSLK